MHRWDGGCRSRTEARKNCGMGSRGGCVGDLQNFGLWILVWLRILQKIYLTLYVYYLTLLTCKINCLWCNIFYALYFTFLVFMFGLYVRDVNLNECEFLCYFLVKKEYIKHWSHAINLKFFIFFIFMGNIYACKIINILKKNSLYPSINMSLLLAKNVFCKNEKPNAISFTKIL